VSDDSKGCEVCEALRDELGDCTFQYVLAGARLQASVEDDEFPRLKTEVEKTQAKYAEAREDLIRHYQESHPLV
jgi:hypothetical protein